jgi:hypothetical protein
MLFISIKIKNVSKANRVKISIIIIIQEKSLQQFTVNSTSLFL